MIPNVLLATVREGIKTQEWFGYANSVDDTGRYNGLQFGSLGGSIYLDDKSVLVKPDVAAIQLQADATPHPDPDPVIPPPDGDESTGTGTGTTPPEPQPVSLKRFYGTINLDAIRTGHNAQQVIEEVVQHLTGLSGADVKVTMEIQAVVSGGVPNDVIRIVTENCRFLGFTTQGFEEE